MDTTENHSNSGATRTPRLCACNAPASPSSKYGLCSDCSHKRQAEINRLHHIERYRRQRELDLGGKMTMPCSCGCGVDVPRIAGNRYASPECPRAWKYKPKKREYKPRPTPKPEAPSGEYRMPQLRDLPEDWPERAKVINPIIARLKRRWAEERGV